MNFSVATGIVSALVVLTCSAVASADDLDQKVWHNSLQKAHVVAKSTSKPILIVFDASWCKYCKKLEKETLSDPKMHAYIEQNFIPVHLDLDEEKAIGKILEVKSLPCTVVLSSNADLLGKIIGYKNVDEMKEQLEKALETQRVLRQASQGRTVK